MQAATRKPLTNSWPGELGLHPVTPHNAVASYLSPQTLVTAKTVSCRSITCDIRDIPGSAGCKAETCHKIATGEKKCPRSTWRLLRRVFQ